MWGVGIMKHMKYLKRQLAKEGGKAKKRYLRPKRRPPLLGIFPYGSLVSRDVGVHVV